MKEEYFKNVVIPMAFLKKWGPSFLFSFIGLVVALLIILTLEPGKEIKLLLAALSGALIGVMKFFFKSRNQEEEAFKDRNIDFSDYIELKRISDTRFEYFKPIKAIYKDEKENTPLPKFEKLPEERID